MHQLRERHPPSASRCMAALLEHYGLIGDTTTVALVSRTGSIDWLCLPRIDSDACFAKLVGTDDHGYWAIRPADDVRRVRQRYRGDTLILETELTCQGGRARIIDFMPFAASEKEHDIIRIVEGIEGEVRMHLDLKARFAYGHLIPWIHVDGRRATLVSGPDALAFTSPVRLAPDYDAARLECDFVVRAGDRLPFTLEYYPSHHAMPDRLIDTAQALDRTARQWSEWSSRCHYQGPYRDAVVRSLITLKALTVASTGGLVADLVVQRRRSARGGVPPGAPPPARELPAGVLTHRAHQQRVPARAPAGRSSALSHGRDRRLTNYRLIRAVTNPARHEPTLTSSTP
jgi:GH15 family glucan-1,4-alpha-glucosidase